jgi:hypothetical protein
MGIWDGIKAGAVSTAVVGSGMAADVHNSQIVVADPVDSTAVTTLSEAHQALESAADAEREADTAIAATDVNWEQATSLEDPPGWVAEPTELEAAITQDLTENWDAGDNGWAEGSSGWSDTSGTN